jgi:PAS domain S-box-containing protein
MSDATDRPRAEQAVRESEQHVRAEEALRESEERFRLLADSVTDYAIIMLDPDGLVAGWNTGAERIKGYTAAEIVGRHFSVFYPSELVQAGHPKRELEAALADGHYHEEGERVRKDGSRFWADVTITPVRDDAGQLRGFAKVTRDITARRQTEEALRESEARFRLLAENSRDVIRLYDLNRTIRYASPSCLAVLGYGQEELVGHSASEFQHPEDSAKQEERRRAVTGHSGDVTLSYRSAHKDGGYVWLEASIRAVRDPGTGAVTGYQEAARDITDRRRAEEGLRAAEGRYRDLFENAAGGITQVTAAGEPIDVNRAWASLLGYDSPDQYKAEVPSAISLYVDPLDREALLAAVQEHGAVTGFEVRLRRRDGSTVWVAVDARTYTDDSGQATGLHASGIDISDRKRAEEAARQAMEEAKQASLAKSEFLSRMSHELRTPLHAILGFSELLEYSDLQAEQREDLSQILKGARHLLQLINEALDLSAIEHGDVALSLEPVHAGELLAETLEMLAPLAAARSLKLTAPALAELDVHVRADRQRLKQVLLNLLSNAVKYNRDGGEVAVACLHQASGKVRFEVSDTGFGIAAENLGRVFEPFDRLGTEASAVEGTGLGLTLTKRLIEAMDGELAVESELGRGTRFWFELAVVPAPLARRRTPGEERPAPATWIPGPARTIIYIEDNPSNVKLVETILARRPEVTLLVAAQGGLGLELVREHKPSLVLLDLNLPDISGAEVLRRIRSEPAIAEIPVVMLSADATPGQVERLRRAGANEYLTKPFGYERFLAIIDGTAANPPERAGATESGYPPAVLDPGTIQGLHDLASMPNVGRSAVVEVVNAFLPDALERLALIETAAREGDLAAVGRQAHALAGASGSVGASVLADRCRELEASAKRADLEGVQSEARGLDEVVTAAREALTAAFALDRTDRPEPGHPGQAG